MTSHSFLGNKLGILKKVNYTYSMIQLCTSRHLPKRNESICPCRDLPINACSNLVCNSPEPETTQVSVNR